MRVLFDNGVPKPLRRHLPGHYVRTAFECGWAKLENGDLLAAAASDFEVLITTDSNLQYQQHVDQYEIAVIVLRAFDLSLESFLPLVPELLERITDTQPGKIAYVYADPILERRDQQKGKPPKR